MMGLETIKAMNRENGIRAAEEGQTPFVYGSVDEVRDYEGFPFPNLGDHRPEGWEMVDTHFCDASGFGHDDEPALSVSQFVNLIEERVAEHPGTGWAVIEAGQFQVYVGEFQREVVA